MNRTTFYGENSTREAHKGCCYSTHAEMDAIKKLPKIKIKGKRKNINLVVIRIDKIGYLKNSEPCFKCIEHLQYLNNTSGYKIKNIYYSNADGNIVVKKFSELAESEHKHVSHRFKNQKIA